MGRLPIGTGLGRTIITITVRTVMRGCRSGRGSGLITIIIANAIIRTAS